jgi:uncharacterized YigZ family protein
LDKDQYKEIKSEESAIFKDRGSKFIGLSFRVENRADIEEKLESVKQQYHDARHHCYAYLIRSNQNEEKMNDDGEPSGSAGRPILGQIKSAGLTNCLVIVVRYFGGTKLGVSGLINAYKTAAAEAIKRSKFKIKSISDYYRLSFEYKHMGDIMHIINKYDLPQLKSKFEMDCEIETKIRQKNSKKIAKLFHQIYGVKVDFIKSD